MASARSYSIGPKMSNAEAIAGFLYLPFYAVILSVIISYVTPLMGLSLTQFEHNLVWFCINILFVVIVFRRFLLRSFRAIRFWPFVQTVILGAVLFHAGNLLLGLLWDVLDLTVARFNDATILSFAATDFWLTAVMTVLIAPVVEEVLARGVLFGVIRRKSRIAAYCVSILFFCAMHVWSYIPQYGWQPVLLTAAAYLPAGIALGWCYEKSNTIWAPILLHMLINAVSMSLL